MNENSFDSIKQIGALNRAYLEPWKTFSDRGQLVEEEGICWEELAKIFITRNLNQQNQEIQIVSNLIDNFLTHGNERTQDMVAMYFLETLVNLLDYEVYDGVDLLRTLGPKAKKYIESYNSFCGVANALKTDLG